MALTRLAKSDVNISAERCVTAFAPIHRDDECEVMGQLLTSVASKSEPKDPDEQLCCIRVLYVFAYFFFNLSS